MQFNEHLEVSSTVTTKGQVTIPAEIRRLLGVGPRDQVAFVVESNDVRLRRIRSVATRTAAALTAYFPHPGFTAEEERSRFEDGVALEATERTD